MALRIIGQDAGDEAGFALAVGDVNGDSFADFVVGAPRGNGPDNDREKAGEVAVVLGDDTVGRDLFLGNAERTFFGKTREARLGQAVAVADVNGDGVGDIVMGAPEARAPGSGEGAVYVFFGDNPLPGQPQTDLNVLVADLTIWGNERGGRLGNALATGDFNGDQRDDLLIAAPRQGGRDGRPFAGKVYVVFGRPNILPESEITARASVPESVMEVRGANSQDIAGQGVAAGDINGDGFDDLLIGVPRNLGAGETERGKVCVVLGAATLVAGMVIDLADPDNVALRVLAPVLGDRFGTAVGSANLNGDGAADLLIGAPKSRFTSRLTTGRAYAIFGRSFPLGMTIDLSLLTPDVTAIGPVDQAGLGESVSGADLNNDGMDEWIVGAPGADQRRGQAYRVLGRTTWPTSGRPVLAAQTVGARAGDRAGTASAAGDVNRDGIADLAVSSPQFDGLQIDEAPQAGAMYAILGDDRPGPPAPDCTDGDADGFYAQGHTCGPKDCDDGDPRVQICEHCNGEDADGDGWALEGDAPCINPDCNDNDPTVNPGEPEKCSDGIDNDCDSALDAVDTLCGGPGCDLSNPAVDLSEPENCTDGIDNDCDGAVDGVDTDCGGPGCDVSNPAVNLGAPENCTDGIDNDCDGAVDDLDTDCGGLGVETNCGNCDDDDGDGLKDLLDPDCERAPLELKTTVLKRAKNTPTTIKRMTVRTSLPDGALATDVPAVEAILALSFDERVQVCAPLKELSKRRTDTKMLFRTTSGPAGKLRVKDTGTGSLKIKYKQKGRLELPDGSPPEMVFGLFTVGRTYGGTVSIGNESSKEPLQESSIGGPSQ